MGLEAVEALKVLTAMSRPKSELSTRSKGVELAYTSNPYDETSREVLVCSVHSIDHFAQESILGNTSEKVGFRYPYVCITQW